ncbi:MAG TPA: DMT family transporter [Bacteroidales bacterium]|nr:DMT family transporter [Bacteroidales bacterium]HRR93011.1 DMT family transporter [Bacteroidales bacterium]HRT89557.1 DMT family transporter [Bacteroidales bacterium]
MTRTQKSYLYAILAVLFWSTIPTVFKIGLSETEVLPMLAVASFTSTLVLFAAVLFTGRIGTALRPRKKEIISSMILGLVNPFIYYIILLKAYSLLPGQVAQPLNMIWPIILVFLSVPILKQRIPAKSFLALFISFAGVYIVSSQGHPLNPGITNLPGILLAAGSSFFWALYFIFNMKDGRDEAVKLFTGFLFASIYLIIAMSVTGGWSKIPGLKGFAASVYTGIFEMGITFLLWLKALQMAENTARVSNLVYIAPFISLVFLYFIINEPVYYTTPAGLVLIVAGIYIQNRKTPVAY